MKKKKNAPRGRLTIKSKFLKISYRTKYREGKKTVERNRGDALEEV